MLVENAIAVTFLESPTVRRVIDLACVILCFRFWPCLKCSFRASTETSFKLNSFPSSLLLKNLLCKSNILSSILPSANPNPSEELSAKLVGLYLKTVSRNSYLSYWQRADTYYVFRTYRNQFLVFRSVVDLFDI